MSLESIVPIVVASLVAVLGSDVESALTDVVPTLESTVDESLPPESGPLPVVWDWAAVVETDVVDVVDAFVAVLAPPELGTDVVVGLVDVAVDVVTALVECEALTSESVEFVGPEMVSLEQALTRAMTTEPVRRIA